MIPVSDPSLMASIPAPKPNPADPPAPAQPFAEVMEATRAKPSGDAELDVLKTALASATTPDDMWDALRQYLATPDQTPQEAFAAMLSNARDNWHPLTARIDKLHNAAEAVQEAARNYAPTATSMKRAGDELLAAIDRAITLLQQQIEEEVESRFATQRLAAGRSG
ncbi:MAG: hypothetical protein AAFP87_19025 [Pseudomonadota bacterium]